MAKSDIVPSVAPHTGAWIETVHLNLLPLGIVVAPHTGAWIETGQTKPKEAERKSHPTRVRGLKQLVVKLSSVNKSRTPHGCVD